MRDDQRPALAYKSQAFGDGDPEFKSRQARHTYKSRQQQEAVSISLLPCFVFLEYTENIRIISLLKLLSREESERARHGKGETKGPRHNEDGIINYSLAPEVLTIAKDDEHLKIKAHCPRVPEYLM